MKISYLLSSLNMTEVVRNAVWPIIENDLRYTGMFASLLVPRI